MAGDLTFPNATITVNVTALNVYGNPPELMDRLGQIAGSQQSVLTGVNAMTPALERLTNEVTEERTATAGLRTLVAGLAQQIRDNVDDSAALNALADSLDDDQKQIADSVTANTTTSGSTGTTDGTPTA